MKSALIAAINDTDYYQGFLGLGLAQGRFGQNATNPFMTQMVETYGYIPSHSYGYSAGAMYGKSSLLPTSHVRDRQRCLPNSILARFCRAAVIVS